MMMAAISPAVSTAPASDPASSPVTTTGKARAFVSALKDASQAAPKTDETKSQRPDSKDKDRKDQDDPQPDASRAANASANQAAPSRDAARSGDKQADDREGARTVSRSGARASGKTPASTDADQDAVDTSETPVDAAALAPVLDALKQASAITTAMPVVPQQPAPDDPAVAETATADPLPGTASMLASRIVPASAQQAEAKPAAPAKKNARAEAATDKSAAIDAGAVTAAAPASDPQAQATPDSATLARPGAGQQLAAGGADRALDMAKQGAWLDGLARDIATTGDSASTLRFQASPTHLGSVQVEIARGLEGASVTLTASSEGARSILADAKPQLIAEARAQGIHIASAQVDVSTDSRQPGSGSQPDHRHDPRGDTGLSSQAGGGNGSHGNKQTRSQPFAINQTADAQPAATVEVEESAPASAPVGGMYA